MKNLALIVFSFVLLPVSGSHAEEQKTPETVVQPVQSEINTAIESPRLGRLFYTPQERLMRDKKRFVSAEIPVAKPENETPVQLINGRIERADGHTTTWINGQGYDDVARRSIDSLPGDPQTLLIHAKKGKPAQIVSIGQTTTTPIPTAPENSSGLR